MRGWSDSNWNLKVDNWNKRAIRLLSMIDEHMDNRMCGYSIMDLGAGGQHLKKYLRDNIKYYPIDYVKRPFIENVVVRDFNKNEFFEHEVDVMFMSGILEYIIDWKVFINNSCKYCKKFVALAYNTAISNEEEEKTERISRGWISHISKIQLMDCFDYNGFELIELKEPLSGGADYPETYFLFERKRY